MTIARKQAINSSLQINDPQPVAPLSDAALPSPEPARQGTAPFRPQARLIRLLGEQLISDETTAILELIKNSYDADARRVDIRFLAPSGGGSPSVEIQDDGDGMDLQTLLTGWLEPAVHRKRGGRWKERTPLGRFPLGEKGVGRFAADKLGASMELVTRSRTGADEIVLQIRWGLFESDVYLDEIENHWSSRSPVIFTGDAHGTLIRITELRFQWDGRFLQRIRDSLTRLISPNTKTDDFAIILECSNRPEFSGIVTNRLLDQAPYQLRGRVDASGRLHIEEAGRTVKIVDLRSRMREYLSDGNGRSQPLSCGPFSLALHAWDLDAVSQSELKVDRATRQTLKQWSGISIYRDGFRVLPYGERGDDWLELNQRRVNNPTLRLSNNQIIGIIDVTQQDNPDLRDRTSREGMIDNQAFEDFRQLVLASLAYLEEFRFSRRHGATKKAAAASGDSDPVLQLLAQLHQSAGGPASPSAVAELERAYRARLEEQQRREDNLLRLAGLGIAAERSAPAMAATVAAAAQALQILRRRTATIASGDQVLAEGVTELSGLLDHMVDQLDVLTPLRAVSSKGIEAVDLRAVVADVQQILFHPIRQGQVHLQVTEYNAPVLHAQHGHILQMMLVLFDNALYWLNQVSPGVRRIIRVHLWSKGSRGGFTVADSGPGITTTQAKLIFEPFYSTRREGLGLGLFVARQLAQRYGGDVGLREQKPFLPGANVVVQFPLSRLLPQRRLSEE